MASTPEPFLFLIGHTDAGLRVLRQVFGAHRDVWVAPDASFVPRLAGRRAELESADGFDTERLAGIMSRDKYFPSWGLSEEEAAATMAEALTYPDAIRALYRAGAAAASASRAVDASSNSVRAADVLAMLFPEARFLHVVEDPRQVSIRKYVEEKVPLSKAANGWRKSVVAASDAGAWLPRHRYTWVRLEDLLQDPLGHAKSLAERLDCRLDPDGFQQVEVDQPSRRELHPSEVRTIELMTGDLLKRFGYERQSAVKPLGHKDRLRTIGQEMSGKRPGTGIGAEDLRERMKRLAERRPALGRILRLVAKVIR